MKYIVKHKGKTFSFSTQAAASNFIACCDFKEKYG